MAGQANPRLRDLQELARLYGIQTGYYSVFDRRRKRATPQGMLATLRVLGAPVETLADIPAALRERRQQLWRRVLEPVVVAWAGQPSSVTLRLPAAWAESSAACALRIESGEQRSWICPLSRLPTPARARLEGVRYVARRLPLPDGLPCGYHRLRVEVGGQSFEALLIVSPRHAYSAPNEAVSSWGVFIPLYALHSQRSPGGGDLTDLEALLDWAAGLGAGVVGSLPLVATFLDQPFSPSPYNPVSSLFWNEFYLDAARIPEFCRSPAAQALAASADYRRDLESLRDSPLVDYRRALALKRRVLEELARTFFAQPGEQQAAFQGFLRENPDVKDYARFRAAGERYRASWYTWPERQRQGVLRPGDYDGTAERYHLYVQWRFGEQLQTLSAKARQKGLRLYLDLPLGAHPDGYDVWRHRSVFALEAAGGAPPDDFFVKGQDWGLPPLHPERLREQGYRYFIASLRHSLRQAGILRIDHVTRLDRLFWIPQGLGVSDGVYVRQPAEELYAILTLESHRHQVLLVGENLGMLPPREVRRALARHRILRSHILQFQITTNARRAILPVPRNSVASLNTHDLRPFAGFWEGGDIRDRVELGLVGRAEARRLRQHRRALRQAVVGFLHRRGWLRRRSADRRALLRACLGYLADSPARVMMVNLEDLWLEIEPQNVPGTLDQRPNWRRKARYALEEFSRRPEVVEALREVNRLRKRA